MTDIIQITLDLDGAEAQKRIVRALLMPWIDGFTLPETALVACLMMGLEIGTRVQLRATFETNTDEAACPAGETPAAAESAAVSAE